MTRPLLSLGLGLGALSLLVSCRLLSKDDESSNNDRADDTSVEDDTEDVEPERECDETTDLCASGDCLYDIDVPIAELDLKVTFDGGKVPGASSGDDVLVLFTETTTGDTQSYSFDGDEDTVFVPYGTYDIALQLGASDPRPNSLTTVRRDVEVSGDAGLNLDMPVGEIKLKVTYDGGKVPGASSGSDVLVLFTETSTGETQSYSFDGDEDTVFVPYGTYDIALQLGASDPRPNSLTTVRRDVEVSGDGGLDLNLPVGEIKLNVTYDGGSVPRSLSGDEVLVLFTETSTLETQSYSFDGGEETVYVPHGTYDIALKFGASDPKANSLATVRRDVEVSGDGGLDLDLQVGDVSLEVTYDGGDVPRVQGFDDVSVLFTETSTGETQSVSFEGGMGDIHVPFGTYDIALQFSAFDPRANSLATVRRGVEVKSSAGLNLDLQVEEVTGLVTYDGGKLPGASNTDDLIVRFVEITTGEEQSVSTDGDEYKIDLPSGIYDAQIQLGATDPRPNSLITVGFCLEVP
ncbi:hypothetical protein L6R49_01750 [Myxococcota bacterium]|nr:hypothetical protein [Myxococcota bacterium]